ncbi:site-specific integrase [Nocardioides caeni]|uniref:Site-specific integrase n=2 Tax=Nocardioides caeni TaxID=574700 RepID=A0A4S8N0W4_9ACTN|nr:site-specific integrase [Nocardioides caeni]
MRDPRSVSPSTGQKPISSACASHSTEVRRHDRPAARRPVRAVVRPWLGTRCRGADLDSCREPRRGGAGGRVRRALSRVVAAAAPRLGTLGRMTLGNVKPTHVREWLTERGEVLAPSTLKYVRTFLAAVMASARDDRLITWSPVEGVTVKAAGRSTKAYRQEVLTDEQVEALRKAMPERYHALVTLLAVAGLRIGEALALTVDDIDREAGVIHVRRSMAPNGKTAGPVKSAQSDRAVPVPRDLVKVLSAHMLAFPPLDHVLGRLVFSTPTGLPVRYHRLRWQFEQAAIKAEVPGATPHALRHRAGSVLLNAGVPAATVARALGHTERVLLDIYSHALPEGDDLLRAAMAQRARSGTDVARKGLRVAK